MRYQNVSHATLFWRGTAVKPEEYCPAGCDADWITYFVNQGTLKARSDDATPKPVREKPAKKEEPPL